MKLAVISDTHDNLPNLKKALDWLSHQGIKTLIHCGDIFTQETLEYLSKNFNGNAYVVGDKIDDDYLKKGLKNILYFSGQGKAVFDSKKIAFTHRPEPARKLAYSQQYDLVFYGHTHKPWEEKVNKTRLINPGNLCGILYQPTFALYDPETDQLELKILHQI